MVIDTHHHFWRYDPAEFGWIPDEWAAARRNWLAEDLRAAASAAGIDRVVSVQARQSADETRFLLGIADANADVIAGVVGWLPIAADDFSSTLESHRHEKLVGLRHVVQGEPDGFLARDGFNRGIATLVNADLAYDILILAPQLPQATAFVDRHPHGRFVVDHLAKPFNDRGELEPWRSELRELAKRENVYCKISGGITERDAFGWTSAKLRPYFDAVLESFGPRRVMFGSNWPLTEIAGGIAAWTNCVREWAEPLSSDERDALSATNAIDFYRLRP
jgi:L-fuconolactonase